MTRHKLPTTACVAAVAVTLGAAVAAPSSASAAQSPERGAGSTGAVFVATNSETGNTVLGYARDRSGRLHKTGRFPTGGLGAALPGAVVDPLASQGALTYDSRHRLLYAVNAGSDTITVFGVHGPRLRRHQVIWSRGHLPVSVSVSHDVVYVLDAGGDGAISGYRVRHGRLVHLPGSTRTLGLGNPATPQFLASPSQVAVTPDARNVIVATKTHGVLDTFRLDRSGKPSAEPVVTRAPDGSVPFALSFDRQAHLLVADAAGGASSYLVRKDGRLRRISAFVANGQIATCWTAVARGYLYAANAGSATITAYTDRHGILALRDATGVTAVTDAGPVDVAASGNGHFLYQLATGAGVIDEYHVAANGSLRKIGRVTGLGINNGHGTEGIAAT